MLAATRDISSYMFLYRYLPVLDADQVIKLRKVATGVLPLAVFSEEEIHVLEARLQVFSPVMAQ